MRPLNCEGQSGKGQLDLASLLRAVRKSKILTASGKNGNYKHDCFPCQHSRAGFTVLAQMGWLNLCDFVGETNICETTAEIECLLPVYCGQILAVDTRGMHVRPSRSSYPKGEGAPFASPSTRPSFSSSGSAWPGFLTMYLYMPGSSQHSQRRNYPDMV